MTITLQQAKVGMADKVDQMVIDEFRRASFLLDNLVFDNAVSPGTGGSTLTYGYIKLKTPSQAAIRALNAEYTAGEALREELTTKCVIMGGSYQLDRVIINTAGAVDELAFQMREKIKATANTFHYYAINGDSTGSSGQFDGLKKLLDGSDTEISTNVDVSTSALVTANYQALLDEVDNMMLQLEVRPTMLLMNLKMLAKMRAAARRAGYYDSKIDEFGRNVEYYNGIPMVDAGKYYNGNTNVDVIGIDNSGKTAMYAICVATNGFLGISPNGTNIIQHCEPDMARPGAVKTGDVELVAGVALKNTRYAAVLKGVKVQTNASI